MRTTIKLSTGLVATLLAATAPCSLQAEPRVESNVIYGMYSGLALLMDVHYPANPNGYGVVLIPGSAWRAPLSFDAEPLKLGVDRRSLGVNVLLDSGYTVFPINHRAAPRFRYPAAVEDAQRAVRFIRHYAARYRINPDRIGAVGGSSGGYLVSMLGVLAGDENTKGLDPVDQESSTVQAVVALYPATDLAQFARDTGGANALMSLFLGAYLGSGQPSDRPSEEALLYVEASPASHVSSDDAPFLLVHGDADTVVPFSQSEILHAELTKHEVAVEFIRMPGGGHGDLISAGPNPPDYFGPMIGWFDRHLRNHP